MKFLPAVLVVLLCPKLFGQSKTYDSTTLYRIEVADGNEFTGYITKQDSVSISVKTPRFGVVRIQWIDIKRISEPSKKTDRSVTHERDAEYPVYRNFSQPTGFPLEKGKMIYQNNYLLVNHISIGVTERLSMGAGAVVPGLYWVNAKYSLPFSTENLRTSIGILYGGVLSGGDSGGGAAYGIATIGNKERNASIGVGYGFSQERIIRLPVLTLNAMMKVGERWYLMGEGFMVDDFGDRIGIITLGARRFSRQMSFDIGLLGPYIEDEGAFLAIPWIGVAVKID